MSDVVSGKSPRTISTVEKILREASKAVSVEYTALKSKAVLGEEQR